jgi:hypothetical protein
MKIELLLNSLQQCFGNNRKTRFERILTCAVKQTNSQLIFKPTPLGTLIFLTKTIISAFVVVKVVGTGMTVLSVKNHPARAVIFKSIARITLRIVANSGLPSALSAL